MAYLHNNVASIGADPVLANPLLTNPMPAESSWLPTLLLIGGIVAVAYFLGKQPERYRRRDNDLLTGMLVMDALHDH